MPPFINENVAAQRGAVTHLRPRSQGIIPPSPPMIPQRPQLFLSGNNDH